MEGVTDLPTQEAEGETRPKSPASESNELSASMLSSTLQSAVSTPPTVLSDSMATSSPHEKPTTPVKSIFADDADDEIELPPAQIAAAAAKPKISVADLLAPKVKHNRPARERRSLPVSYNVSQTINAQSGFMYKSARHIRDENAKIPNNELTWRQTISAATPKKRAAPSTPKVVEPTTTTADNTEVGDTSAGDKAETAAVEDTSAGSKKRKRASRAKKEQVPENVLADTPDISTKVVSSKEKEAKELVKKVPRELKRLQDTDGFADPKKANPAFISIWSKGKKIDPKKAAAEARAAARAAKSKSRSASASPKDTPEEKSAEPAAEDEEPKKAEKPKPQYIEQGRYVGQEDIMDLNLTPKERRAKARAARVEKQRKLLPLPMWTGQTTLTKGRDFKLPFGVFNPLPPGSAKPEPYGKMAKSKRLYSMK